MIRRVGRVVLAVLVGCGALALGVSTAGAAGTGNDDLARIANSGAALVKAGSARFSGRVLLSGTSTSGAFTLSGIYDFKHHEGQFNIDASALGVTNASGRITFRLVGGVAYLSLGSFRHLSGGSVPSELAGKQWISIDLAALGASAGSLEQASPASSLDFLRGVTTDVQNLGPAVVNGVPTTHYRIDIDLTKALANVPPADRASVQDLIGALGGASHLPGEEWLDRQGRPVKVSFHVTGTGAHPVQFSETFYYSHFGVPVRVPVPPASQTVDFTKLIQQLGSSLGAATSTTVPAG